MVPSISQIRNYGGGKRDTKDGRAEEYNASLRVGLKEYKQEKSPEVKARLSSLWRLASQQGVNIEAKLSEQVKKVVGQSDFTPQQASGSPAGAGESCGSGPCGSGPCGAAEVNQLMGGLAGNFGKRE